MSSPAAYPHSKLDATTSATEALVALVRLLARQAAAEVVAEGGESDAAETNNDEELS